MAGNQLKGKVRRARKGPTGCAILTRVAADLGITAQITQTAAALQNKGRHFVAEEKRHARWMRQVTAIDLDNAQCPASD